MPGRPAPCRTRPSAVSERRRHRLTPGRDLSWSWVVSIHRLACFRRALSQLSYTTMEPAPGLEPGTTGVQSQRPSRWARPAPAGGLVTRRRRAGRTRRTSPRRGGPPESRAGRRGVAHRHPARTTPRRGPPSPVSTPCATRFSPFSRFGRKGSNPHFKDQNLASFRWTTPERRRWRGQWVPPPITRGWKPRMYLSTP